MGFNLIFVRFTKLSFVKYLDVTCVTTRLCFQRILFLVIYGLSVCFLIWVSPCKTLFSLNSANSCFCFKIHRTRGVMVIVLNNEILSLKQGFIDSIQIPLINYFVTYTELILTEKVTGTLNNFLMS